MNIFTPESYVSISPQTLNHKQIQTHAMRGGLGGEGAGLVKVQRQRFRGFTCMQVYFR